MGSFNLVTKKRQFVVPRQKCNRQIEIISSSQDETCQPADWWLPYSLKIQH